jgi:Sulfotransferase family
MKDVLREPLAVRPASHARISFNIDSPEGTGLVIEHLRGDQLLARESRPLATGANSLETKTHPDATHMACSLQINRVSKHVNTLTFDRRLGFVHPGNSVPIKGAHFSVECGERIEPASRHFIIIGAMKAGTTTLFELLANHPALCGTWAHLPGVSFTKEVNYFTRQYRSGDTPLHYDWRFPFDTKRHAWTLDASPNYAKWPRSKGVPERIAALGAETKLAYILREPVARIESHMAHLLHRKGRASLGQCIRTSSYALQLDKFVPHIERDDILLLDFEQLRRNPDAVVAQVCDFLGIGYVPGSSIVHNRRRSRFRLTKEQQAELTEALRPDVERLVNVYGFSPAKRWLRKSPLSRFRLSGFRK